MRKVFVEVKVRLVIDVDDGVEVSEILDEMEFDFTDTTGKADVNDSAMLDYEVTDSK